MADSIDPHVLPILEADHGILDAFGMTVSRVRDGVCEIACVVPEHLVNAAGFAHGSITYALMDTACAYALASVGVRGVTVQGNTTYVKGASAGAGLQARVDIASRTRRVATLRGEVFVDGQDGPVLAAHGTFVFQLIEVRTNT